MLSWLASSALMMSPVGGLLKGLWTWLTSLSFWQIVSLGLALFAGLQTIRLGAEQRHAHKVETQLSRVVAARKADRAAYEKAQADAQVKNLTDVARAKQQQDRINDETVANLNARLERLRRELSSTPQSHPGKPGLPQGGPAPGGAAGEARVCLTAEELLRAAESEERHDRLIDWVIRQSEVDPNKP